MKRHLIYVYLHELQKYYDGTPLSYGPEDYDIIGAPPELNITLELHISKTDSGLLTTDEINNRIGRYMTFRVIRDGEDVTSQYGLVVGMPDGGEEWDDYIPLRVDKRNIELTSASQTRTYDGTPLTDERVSVTKGALVPGHILTAKGEGVQTEIGSSLNIIRPDLVCILDADMVDVTNQYNISYIFGTLTVLEEDDGPIIGSG